MKDVNIREEAGKLNAQLVEWRRHLHAHPELGFDTVETAAFVVERLGEMGVTEIRTGVAKNGVAAVIRGDLPGKVLGMRADMDALPVREETGLPFASTVDGRMHACGHDAHTAMLLGAARLLTAHRDKLKGAVKLIFQPSEETGSGAPAMIADGVLENPKVDAFIGLHTGNFWTGVDAGEIGYSNGPLMAAADMFTITVTGKGGHGATPHRTIDPIAIGCQIYTTLQTIVSREISPLAPAVLTIGTFQSGSAGNIVPPDCVMKGTLRALTAETRKELQDRIRGIVEGVASAMRGSASVEFHYGPPPTTNAPEMTAKLLRAAGAVVGPEHVREVDEPTMGGEDMAFFLEKAPGVFFFHPSTFGGGRDYPHHHPKFDLNEDVLWTGTGTMAQFALTWQDD
ncbi:MAG: M20 family metallopeptidase [Fretibacterium sp.]|uniref:M20 metallopeptidase family protein n=1 Tax=Fretibacterium sp. OH1220_COT-178 TaxID=2491047 RepID=UPI000F5E486B|nr:M20 family metallopeptidase [Fretibacterium sp. OH1220_COT-178]MDO4786194.1 M20 family metallopeptidase [Fretibacterium sp.]RRD63878.1 amidohydrolase [Fretibacterium sp. OH1220_COT-178]